MMATTETLRGVLRTSRGQPILKDGFSSRERPAGRGKSLKESSPRRLTRRTERQQPDLRLDAGHADHEELIKVIGRYR